MADGWEVLEVVGTEEEAELIAGYLRSREIDCVVESLHSHEFPVNVTKLGEVRVEVPSAQLEAARELLERRVAADVDSSPWESGQLDGKE
ncbi:MAG: DUF2007 domain-containing protein [Thermoanaerobaculia bacterium]|nr:DUF2007 domain-containing protein [Thermoanaerobaculia bacterium]